MLYLTFNDYRVTGAFPTEAAAHTFRPDDDFVVWDITLAPADRRMLALWLELDKGLVDLLAVREWLATHLDDQADAVSRAPLPSTSYPGTDSEQSYIGGAYGSRCYMPAHEQEATTLEPERKGPLFRALNHKTFGSVPNPDAQSNSTPQQVAWLNARIDQLKAERNHVQHRLTGTGRCTCTGSRCWGAERDAEHRALLTRSLATANAHINQHISRLRKLTQEQRWTAEFTFWSEQPARNLSGYRRIIVAVYVEPTSHRPAHWSVVYAEERTAAATWVARFTGQSAGKAKTLRYWHPVTVLNIDFPPDQAGSIEAEQAAITWAQCIRMDESDRHAPDPISALAYDDLYAPGSGRTVEGTPTGPRSEDEDGESDFEEFDDADVMFSDWL